MVFGAELESADRRLVHQLCEELGLAHQSTGDGPTRRIRAWRAASSLEGAEPRELEPEPPELVPGEDMERGENDEEDDNDDDENEDDEGEGEVNDAGCWVAKVVLQFGRAKHELSVPMPAVAASSGGGGGLELLSRLQAAVAAATGVAVDDQRLVWKGKTLDAAGGKAADNLAEKLLDGLKQAGGGGKPGSKPKLLLMATQPKAPQKMVPTVARSEAAASPKPPQPTAAVAAKSAVTVKPPPVQRQKAVTAKQPRPKPAPAAAPEPEPQSEAAQAVGKEEEEELSHTEKKRLKRARQKALKLKSDAEAAAAEAASAAASAAAEDVDAMLAEVGLPLPGCCGYFAPQCKAKIGLVGQICPYCRLKFCLKHFHAEKHGCSADLRKTGRDKWLAGTTSGGAAGPMNESRRLDLKAQLASKLDKSAAQRDKKRDDNAGGGGKKKKKKKR